MCHFIGQSIGSQARKTCVIVCDIFQHICTFWLYMRFPVIPGAYSLVRLLCKTFLKCSLYFPRVLSRVISSFRKLCWYKLGISQISTWHDWEPARNDPIANRLLTPKTSDSRFFFTQRSLLASWMRSPVFLMKMFSICDILWVTIRTLLLKISFLWFRAYTSKSQNERRNITQNLFISEWIRVCDKFSALDNEVILLLLHYLIIWRRNLAKTYFLCRDSLAGWTSRDYDLRGLSATEMANPGILFFTPYQLSNLQHRISCPKMMTHDGFLASSDRGFWDLGRNHRIFFRFAFLYPAAAPIYPPSNRDDRQSSRTEHKSDRRPPNGFFASN